MDRENAIKYLSKKGKIDVSDGKFPNDSEHEIDKVMKKGRIYGDPVAECY